jgi:para-aminobenzoate synthetase component 1
MMIVDLLRNDLSRVCEPGSVYVPELFTLERMSTVQHLVSTVRGQLRRDANEVDLFRACFPGGSITGAPKTRAMQVIASIERIGRGVYCGAIGYFAADGGALFNIAIRTVTLAGGTAAFSAGGGIVLDSVPESEYAESLAKAEAMRKALS